jgi:hypothetical protein
MGSDTARIIRAIGRKNWARMLLPMAGADPDRPGIDEHFQGGSDQRV